MIRCPAESIQHRGDHIGGPKRRLSVSVELLIVNVVMGEAGVPMNTAGKPAFNVPPSMLTVLAAARNNRAFHRQRAAVDIQRAGGWRRGCRALVRQIDRRVHHQCALCVHVHRSHRADTRRGRHNAQPIFNVFTSTLPGPNVSVPTSRVQSWPCCFRFSPSAMFATLIIASTVPPCEINHADACADRCCPMGSHRYIEVRHARARRAANHHRGRSAVRKHRVEHHRAGGFLPPHGDAVRENRVCLTQGKQTLRGSDHYLPQ